MNANRLEQDSPSRGGADCNWVLNCEISHHHCKWPSFILLCDDDGMQHFYFSFIKNVTCLLDACTIGVFELCGGNGNGM